MSEAHLDSLLGQIQAENAAKTQRAQEAREVLNRQSVRLTDFAGEVYRRLHEKGVPPQELGIYAPNINKAGWMLYYEEYTQDSRDGGGTDGLLVYLDSYGTLSLNSTDRQDSWQETTDSNVITGKLMKYGWGYTNRDPKDRATKSEEDFLLEGVVNKFKPKLEEYFL